jgi:hypothetical protein
MRSEQQGALGLALIVGFLGSLWAGFGLTLSVGCAVLTGQLGYFYAVGLSSLKKEDAGFSKSGSIRQTSEQDVQTDALEPQPNAELLCPAETQTSSLEAVDKEAQCDSKLLVSIEVQAAQVLRSMSQATSPLEVRPNWVQTAERQLSIASFSQANIEVSDLVLDIEPAVQYVVARQSLSPQERRFKDFKFDKEVVIQPLQCEKVVEEDTCSYSLSSQVEAQTHIPVEMFNAVSNQPIFISLINFAHDSTAHANYRLFREFFSQDQRFVKASSQSFHQVADENYLDTKEFQTLFMSTFLANVATTSLILVDGLGDTEKHWLRYHFRVKTGLKHLVVLHNRELKQSAEAFEDLLWSEFEYDLPELRTEHGYFYDAEMDIWHLPASDEASFSFVEALVTKRQATGFDPGSSCFVNPLKQFKFEDFFCEAFVKTLQYMLLPVFNPAVPQFLSEGHVQEYGYQALALYKNLNEMPWSVLIEPRPPQTIFINPLTLASQRLFSTMHMDKLPKERPYCAFFLSPCKLDFEEIFGPQSFSAEYLDIYASSPPIQSDFGDTRFEILTTWVLGSFMSDYILFVLDFQADPYLDRSELLVRYLSIFQEIDKPLLIMHRTSPLYPYQESLTKANALLRTSALSDRIILHEELTSCPRSNSALLKTVREQIQDNLGPVEHAFELGALFQRAFDLTVAKLLVVMNSRKREMLVRSQGIQLEEGFCASVELEAGWRCVIKEHVLRTFPEFIFVSPAYFEIDERIYSEIKFKDEPPTWVRCAVLSNQSLENFEAVSLAAQFCTQHISQAALLLPSLGVSPQANHINTPEFNQLFMSSFVDRLADCLILVLNYEGGKLPGDFDVISKVIAKRLVRENKKPMIVVHAFDRMKDLDAFFQEFQEGVAQVTQMFCEWSGIPRPTELLSHKQANEGIYAFDKENQVIHRAYATGAPKGWRWYNCILYKIMHDAVLKLADRTSFRSKVVQVFGELLRELLVIEDDEARVQPQVLYEGFVNERTLPQSVVDTVYCSFSPAWVVSHRA